MHAFIYYNAREPHIASTCTVYILTRAKIISLSKRPALYCLDCKLNLIALYTPTHYEITSYSMTVKSVPFYAAQLTAGGGVSARPPRLALSHEIYVLQMVGSKMIELEDL